MRLMDNHAEEHRRFNDAVEGNRTLGSPRVFRGRLELDGPQDLLLREDLRDQVLNETHTVSVRGDQIDGRALKVVEIRVRDINQLWRRYWIDLGRNGLIVRVEAYWGGELLNLKARHQARQVRTRRHGDLDAGFRRADYVLAALGERDR